MARVQCECETGAVGDCGNEKHERGRCLQTATRNVMADGVLVLMCRMCAASAVRDYPGVFKAVERS